MYKYPTSWKSQVCLELSLLANKILIYQPNIKSI